MIIGGHWGMEVHRENGVIVKLATANGMGPEETMWDNDASLAREAQALRVMAGSGFAPELLDERAGRIVQSDLGDSGSVTNEHAWRRNATRMLWTIRKRGLRHGDLTGANIITRDNQVWAVDWQEAHELTAPLDGSPLEGLRSTSDSALLFAYLQHFKSDSGEPDMSRIARRWLVVLMALGANAHQDNGLPLKGKYFLDLGCFQGDFCGAAAAEGMAVVGVDVGSFREEENSIAIARTVWEGMHCAFHQHNIFGWPDFAYDVVMMFSTWPYLVQTAGREASTDLLGRIINACGVFLFETQLHGDGPGPEFLKTNTDVANMLGAFGTPTALGTFPVNGRDALRTVWAVRGDVV